MADSPIQTIFINKDIKFSGYTGEYIFERIHVSDAFYEQPLLDKWVLPQKGKLHVVYDIGANIGNHTVYFAKVADVQKIYSFEPMPSNLTILQKNIAQNDLFGVELIPYALGSKKTTGRMGFSIDNNGGSAQLKLDDEISQTKIENDRLHLMQECVQIEPLDDLGLPMPDFVKIDVEGFEVEVLEGMEQTLTLSNPLVWIEIDDKNGEKVFELMKGLGYLPVDYDLTSSNNVLFQKKSNGKKFQATLFADLLKQASRTREKHILLNQRTSNFEYEQKLVAILREEQGKTQVVLYNTQKELQNFEGQLQTTSKNLDMIKAQLWEKEIILKTEIQDRTREKEELENQIKKMAQNIAEEKKFKTILLKDIETIYKELEQEAEKHSESLQLLTKESKQIKDQLRETSFAEETLRNEMNQYRKAKLFRLMIFIWSISTKLRYKKNIQKMKIGHSLYTFTANKPKMRFFFTKINSRANIFRNTEDVISFRPEANPGLGAKAKGHAPREMKTRYPEDICVAAILDPFSYNSFKYECQLLPIEPGNWKEIFDKNRIDIFFCESAWTGTNLDNRPWKGQVYGSENFQKENRTTLLKILKHCNDNLIPTVFWNKEDPTHYNDKAHNFVDTALRFDHIFTTASECVQAYKEDYGHPSVHLLMFATQPRLFNPIETYHRSDDIVFAGGWYQQHPDRCKEMEIILDGIRKSGNPLKIYDRYYGQDDPNHVFPEKYKEYIFPSLPHDKMEIAYKGSKYALNFNTVTESDSMFARRVYELISSNTLVISNYSKGMAKLFGDAIVFAEGEKAIKIIDADAKREKALNEVLQKHTYKNRLNEILQVAGVEINDSLPEVTLIYQIRNLQDANLAEEHYNAILWNNKKMIFVADESDGATLLRKCLELYQCPRKEVLPRTCVNTLIIKSQYCIFANLNLSHDFIFRAVPHTSYIDMDQTGIVEAPNEQKYMFNKINGLDNVLIKTRSSNGELIDEKIRHLEGVGPILFNNPSPIVQLYNI